MQKKPGQISSNTLSLRFMKNAAKAKQEREVEETKAKVRSEEEWELAPELRDSWGVQRQVDNQTVSYEPSYLPFLFPGLSDSSKRTVPMASGTVDPDDWSEDGSDRDEDPAITFRGRRKFGKYGKEAIEQTPIPAPPPPPIQETALPRGIKSISSHWHGHGAASSSQSNSSRRLSPPPPQAPNLQMQPPPMPQGFKKPKVDAPRAREKDSSRKRRLGEDATGMSNGNNTDEIDNEKMKKKRRRE